MRIYIMLTLLAAGCTATGPFVTNDFASLAEAETAFAAQSVREDMRTAFIANFGPDGVLVRKEWTNAKADLEPRAAPPIVLDWRPVYTLVAASGEIGLSTGPWKLTSKTDSKEPPRYGQFVSIWKREPGGPWKVAVDLGTSNPRGNLWSAPLATLVTDGTKPRDGTSVDAAERRFQDEMRASGFHSAYERYGAASLRMYREGYVPMIGRDMANTVPAFPSTDLAWTVERIEVARSGDFGYARGHYASASEPGKVLGYFLRVWRVEDGEWRIVADVTNPAS